MAQHVEQLVQMMQAEKKAREYDYTQAQARIRELEDHLGEIEEENINLQNQIYEQKVARSSNKHETHSQVSGMHKESIEADGNLPDSLNNSPVHSKAPS